MWMMPPIPMVPYQLTRCRLWFMASVATRSPLPIPSRSSAAASLRASRAIPAQLVRVSLPAAQCETIYRSPCSRYAWSRSRIILSGQSCIPPIIVASPILEAV